MAQSGIRGVPANFGGSETAVQEIGRRLAACGDDVVVYCRAHNNTIADRHYLGMTRIVLPSVNTFHLDTVTHSILSSFHLLLRDSADVIHFHGMGNALCLPIFAFSRKKTVITIDGPDWERAKWGPIARRVLKLSARLAVKLADHLIIDNHPSIEYFRREFGVRDASFTYIPYGADLEPPERTDYVDALGLRPRGFVLFVGALVPDKGPDILIDAYKQVSTDMPLVVVGDSPFASGYRRSLRESAADDSRIRMLGYVYGHEYRQLLANAYAYVHPLRNDGTSPALLQAMGYGSCIIVNSLPEALSAVGDAGLPFARNSSDDLARQLEHILENEDLATSLRNKARRRARTEYNWDAVAAAHRCVYEGVLCRGRSGRVARGA